MLRAFHLWNKNQVRLLGNDLFQIFETERQLIDADHPLAIGEAHAPQGIAHEDSRSELFRGVNRVFEIKDDSVRFVQCRIDEILWLSARKVKAGTSQAIARRRRRKWHLLRERSGRLRKARLPDRRFDSCRDHEGQRAFVFNREMAVLNTKLP